MIRQYKNKKIEKNLKISNILFTISICLTVVTVIVYLIIRLVTKTAESNYIEILFCLFAFLTPTAPMFFRDLGIETESHNDFSNTLWKIVVIHIEVYILVLFTIISGIVAAVDGNIDFFLEYAGYCGYFFIAHSFSYIGSYILIYNCVLIKREWKENPPAFYKKKCEEKERKHNETNYKQLIEKCGIKFFIKYYKQIKRLPLRDVAISENFSPSEREERLLAAKKIIDLNLSKYALSEILKTYGDILNSAEIEQAKTLLEEIKAEKVNTELEYKPWLRNKSNGDAANKPSAECEYRGYLSEYYANQHSGNSDKTQKGSNPATTQNKDTCDD